jgi:hypothetical protein
LKECPTARRKLKKTIKAPPVIKLTKIDIFTKELVFSFVGKDGNESLDLTIYYSDYLEDFGNQGFSILKYDEKLKDVVTREITQCF